ncbi:MAG: hypothetical protein EOP22_11985 [Hyphomicrobiales bacterium]|nr:MAG: hypothetical protein EOP22_11985 [Hyphomicrobiales bacterium]
MARRPSNIFNFRRLKWGAPKRLDGLKAIGLEGGQPGPVPSRGGGIGLVLVALAGGVAIVMGLLGWF